MMLTPGVYNIDGALSAFKWKGVKKIGKTHEGTVDILGGNLTVAEDGSLTGEVTLDMNSIKNTDAGLLVDTLLNHLRSDDFFSVEAHPTAKLVVKSFVEGNITADLTIKGITNEIIFPVDLKANGQHLWGSAKFSFDRSKWNVRYGSGSFFENLGDELIYDDIEVAIELKAAA